MKRKIKDVFLQLKRTPVKHNNGGPAHLAGIVVCCLIFPMAPGNMIIVTLTGIMPGKQTIQEKKFVEINNLIGENDAQYIRNLVAG